jgi:polyribonucleotide nucleotidyltransferase
MTWDFSISLGRDKINFNTGYLAKQADGAVAVSCGETVVLASAVASKEVSEGQDFFPLMVDYREKYYSAGKIPGGFIKRPGRPNDREVLTSRLTDRPIRPLFPKEFINEVQVIIYVLSSDAKVQPDVLAINAASSALIISGIPFKGPVGAVRVGRINGEMIINPTFSESRESDIDLIVAGTKRAVTMIEGSAKNVSEEDMISAVEFAHENIIKLCVIQEEMSEACAKPAMTYRSYVLDDDLKNEVRQRFYLDIENLSNLKEKKEREKAFYIIVERAQEALSESYPETFNQIRTIMDEYDREIVRKKILDEGIRADGRNGKDIRPIDIMVGLLPRTHGSAVFTRGQTQSLAIVTLGTFADSQRLDAIEGESQKRFMLHYNFPHFSVGEVGRIMGAGRREIGHGMLAERAIQYCLPQEIDFPYTIRVVSEILESNGSSSMASVCAGSLAMFNAGIPMKTSVAGIAMGLVMEDNKYAILSDILGIEDHFGDMDFKVAGTSEGITAFQMDIKIEGITPEIMREALNQARDGRLFILEKMNAVLSEPEKNLSPYVPKIKMITVETDKIGEIIGPGGKVIKGIIEETGAEINIEDDGTVTIASMEQSAIDKAEKIIRGIVEDVEVGKIYTGVVKKIMEYGAFVEILPGKEGLIHISKLDFKKTKNVTDVINEGDEIDVKVIKIDKFGRIDLSRRDALKK